MIPQGYDKNDPNWKGDVTKAPGLKRSELDSYDPRVDVAFSTKAWMNKQVCEYDLQRILKAVGDEDHEIHVSADINLFDPPPEEKIFQISGGGVK